jgi:hypothetical protein
MCKSSVTPCSVSSVSGRYSHSCCKGEAGDEPPTRFTLPPVTKEAQGHCPDRHGSLEDQVFFSFKPWCNLHLIVCKASVTPCFRILYIRVVLTMLMQRWGWRRAPHVF